MMSSRMLNIFIFYSNSLKNDGSQIKAEKKETFALSFGYFL